MIQAARVVPDVPSFSVDRGFWYSIPDHLASEVQIGVTVRVPLGGRRVRGWVTALGDRAGTLKDISGVSSPMPIFEEAQLRSLEWAANHYVAPVAGLLRRAAPPNLPKNRFEPVAVPSGESAKPHPLDPLVERSVDGRPSPPTAVVGNWRSRSWFDAIRPVLVSGGSVMVVAATDAEARYVGTSLTAAFGGEAVVVVTGDDAEETAAWERAQTSPVVLVGTPKVAAWRVDSLSLAVILEEGRRAMKDRQTPTIHARDFLVTRSRVERFNLVCYGPTPSVELMAQGADIVFAANRAWSLVEVVDRSSDPPGSGYLAAQTVAAIDATSRANKKVFVFTHSRAGSSAVRCADCRQMRRCPACARPAGEAAACRSCGTDLKACSSCGNNTFEALGTIPSRLIVEINHRLGRDEASEHAEDAAIRVGTERDLANLNPVDLVVVADLEGMLNRPGFRASEDALRQLGRLGSMVARGAGSRMLVQTMHPDSALVVVLRRGNPVPFMERVLVERAREAVPPAVEFLLIELRGHEVPEVGLQLDASDAVDVLGPLPIDGGVRWLVTGRVDKVRPQLRTLVRQWRDAGLTVRVDADPIDL